jgi:hypothetical protein
VITHDNFLWCVLVLAVVMATAYLISLGLKYGRQLRQGARLDRSRGDR